MSNGCKEGDGIVDEWFLRDELLDYLGCDPDSFLEISFTIDKKSKDDAYWVEEDYSHWCLKGDEGFVNEEAF